MITDDQANRLREVFIQYGVTLAYLFGSQAEGTARPDSDVDIAVLLPHGAFRQLSTDGYLRLVTDIVVVFDREDVDVVLLNEAPGLLAREIVTEGKVIYEDPLTRPAVDFTVFAIRQYVDTEHFRRISRRYLYERVERFRLRHAALSALEKQK